MKLVLYILTLKDKQAFKVGITDNDSLDRVKQLSRIYQFDLTDSFIVQANNNKTTKQLERQILADYKQFKYELGKQYDGSTEFITYDQLTNVISEIEFKSRLAHLGISIKKNIEFKQPEIIDIPIEERKKKKKRKFLYLKLSDYERFKYDILKNKNKFKFYREVKDNHVIGTLISFDFELTRSITMERTGIYYKSNHGSGAYSIYSSAGFNKKINVGYISLLPVARCYQTGDFNDNFRKVSLKINGRIADMYSIFRRELRPADKEEIEKFESLKHW